MNYQDYMMNTSELKKDKKITLLKKADFLDMVDLKFLNEFKKWKVDELRDHFKITHIIDGKFKDMRGNCFGCLTSLRHDYTSNINKNYCMDCL